MRLNRNQIKGMCGEMLGELLRQGLVTLEGPPEPVVSALEKAVTEDLMVEDRLNDEVRDILKAHQREMDQGRMDYNAMFELIKKKLVRERGIIL